MPKEQVCLWGKNGHAYYFGLVNEEILKADVDRDLLHLERTDPDGVRHYRETEVKKDASVGQ